MFFILEKKVIELVQTQSILYNNSPHQKQAAWPRGRAVILSDMVYSEAMRMADVVGEEAAGWQAA